MKVPILTTDGKKDGDVDLPLVFSTEFRKDLIHKAFTNLNSHKFQKHNRMQYSKPVIWLFYYLVILFLTAFTKWNIMTMWAFSWMI